MSENLKYKIKYLNFQIMRLILLILSRFLKYKIFNAKSIHIDSSKTCYILGSGGSVNKYERMVWFKISNEYSIGFNDWLIHNFIPQLFVIELYDNKENYEIYLNNLKIYLKKVSNVTFILKLTKLSKKSLNFYNRIKNHFGNNKFYVLYIFEVPGNNLRLFESKFNKLYSKTNLYFSKRASIAPLIILASKIGFKKIVLCGIDLNNSIYFYDEKNSDLDNRMNKPIFNRYVGSSHSTNIVSPNNKVKIDEVIKVINNKFSHNRVCEIYIGSKSSELYKILPFNL